MPGTKLLATQGDWGGSLALAGEFVFILFAYFLFSFSF
jgi:hypothetical protein